MFDDIKKSLSSIIYERTTSPFYGTIIVSWALWNWRIIYLTFFISEKTLKVDKITYIFENCSNINVLIIYPICSTILLLTIIPFVSNGAFWLNLKFENWKKVQKNQIERKQLLTLEQSLELREQLIYQESRFEKLLLDKNNEIKQLKEIIEKQLETKETKTNPAKSDPNKEVILNVYNKIKNNSTFLSSFDKLINLIQGDNYIVGRSDVSSKLITLLEVNNLIIPKGNGVYTLTESGKELTKLLIE